MLAKLRDLAMHWSRGKKMVQFNSLCSAEESVLDVGVSPNDWSDSVNIFLKQFKGKPTLYTGLAVEDISGVAELHPQKNFCLYDGGIFPFANNSFDWIFSNAVIEHVGDRQAQALFIKEMCRVADKVFFTTPNKYFPVESHTNTFFRHWSSPHFYDWCAKCNPLWSEDNLLLLSRSNLQNALKEAGVKKYSITVNRILGWPMTFTVVI